jgi:hypothetical protein
VHIEAGMFLARLLPRQNKSLFRSVLAEFMRIKLQFRFLTLFRSLRRVCLQFSAVRPRLLCSRQREIHVSLVLREALILGWTRVWSLTDPHPTRTCGEWTAFTRARPCNQEWRPGCRPEVGAYGGAMLLA